MDESRWSKKDTSIRSTAPPIRLPERELVVLMKLLTEEQQNTLIDLDLWFELVVLLVQNLTYPLKIRARVIQAAERSQTLFWVVIINDGQSSQNSCFENTGIVR